MCLMTDKERQMLEDLHEALLGVPAGSGTDAKPLLEDIRVVVMAYKRASWATRALIWMLPAIAGIGVAFQTVKGWFQ